MWSLFVDAAWKVIVAGFVFGVGLPALFALGVRSTVLASGDGAAAGTTSSASPSVNRLLGYACYALVLIVVVLGLLVIIGAGLGKEVSFEHVYPTLAPKS